MSRVQKVKDAIKTIQQALNDGILVKSLNPCSPREKDPKLGMLLIYSYKYLAVSWDDDGSLRQEEKYTIHVIDEIEATKNKLLILEKERDELKIKEDNIKRYLDNKNKEIYELTCKLSGVKTMEQILKDE